MEKQTYTIERVFNARRKEVWRAITEKDLMRQWYFDLPEFKAEVGFVFEFTAGEEGGVQYLHRCEITEVVPEQKLTYSWSYPGYEGTSYVTFELFDEGTDTTLRLTHSGLETFPAEVKDFAFKNFENGWNYIIGTSLREFLNK